MLTLPKKEKFITVPVRDGQYGDLEFEMETLTEMETVEMTSGTARTQVVREDVSTVEIKMPLSDLVSLFKEKFRKVVGEEIEIEGESFDPRNPTHMESIPVAWKIQAMQELVRYCTRPMPKETAKNSSSPASV